MEQNDHSSNSQKHESLPNNKSTGQVPDAFLQNVLARVGLGTTRNNLELSEAAALKALKGPNWNDRASALQALETLEGQAALTPILVALDDVDGSVRAIAVRMLGSLAYRGEHVPVERLLIALHDPEWHVRETAVFALEKLGEQVPVEALHAVLQDEDFDVQEAAKLVLQEMENKSSPILLSSKVSVSEEDSRSMPQSQVGNIGVPIHQQAHRMSGVRKLREQFYSSYNRLKHGALHNQEAGDDEMLGEQLDSRNAGLATESVSVQKLPQIKHRPVLRVIEGVFAAIIIMGIITGWFVLTHGLRPSTAGTILFTQDVSGNNYTLPGWTSDGKYVIWSGDLASGTGDHVYVWNATTGQFSKWGPIPGVADVESAPDGRYISRVTADGKVRIWDLVTGRSTTIYTVPAGQYPGVTWSSDSKLIALSLQDGTVQKILDVETGKVLVTVYPNHSLNQQSYPVVLFWSPNGQLIATSFSGSKSIQIWDAATGKQVQTVADIGAGLMGWAPDGQRIIVGGALRGSNDSSLRIWDAVTGHKLLTYTGHSKRPTTFGWLPDGRELLSKSDNEVLVWDTFTGHTILKFANAGSVNGLSWSPDGKYIAVNNGVDTVQIWSAITGLKISTYRVDNVTFVKVSGGSIYSGSLEWSPNGKYLISAGKDGTVLVWNAITGSIVHVYDLHFNFNGSQSLQWSPDGRMIAVSNGNGMIAVLQAPNNP